jgi:glucose/arabinose dehydrogenase
MHVRFFVAAIFASLALAASAHAATTTVTPAAATRAAVVNLRGVGFGAGRIVAISLGARHLKTVRANGVGRFSTSVRVPAGTTLGAKRLLARSQAAAVANSLLVVRNRPLVSSATTATSSGRRVTLSPVGGRIGDRVTVRGIGFHTGRRVAVVFAGKKVASPLVQRRRFTARFNVPVSSAGLRRLDVIASPKITMSFRVACGTRVRVCAPYGLPFLTDRGGIRSGNGVGTGFTWVAARSGGSSGYLPANLRLDPSSPGALNITTTAGLLDADGTQVNALGVGIDAGNGIHTLKTVLRAPPAGSGNSEQAGLWFGIDQTRYFKLALISTSSGTKAQLRYVEAGQAPMEMTTGVLSNVQTLALALRLDPDAETIRGTYSRNGSAFDEVGEFANVPSDYFNVDAAGIDPLIGTRVFGGVFASHREGPAPLTYRFDSFAVTRVAPPPPPPPPPGEPRFTRTHVPNVSFPTSMVWAPKAGRLYVTELTGKIHWIQFNAQKQVVARGAINTVGFRLALGITVDPASTATNTILWVTHSHPPDFTKDAPFRSAPANSGIVSRLRQNNSFAREDIITGLPRSANDHATNSLHFGPDGKLYIASGGNTGAGAAFQGDSEFPGLRAEQPLSAAILVANVKAAGFNGNCAAANLYATPPCMNQGWVTPYATGLRNAYDFVFHSNGSMYAPDNGLGLRGMVPPTTAPPCTEPHSAYSASFDPAPGPDAPGPVSVHDFFYRVVQGKYYGHPNPTHGECVWGDGSVQSAPARSNYTPPLWDLGNHRSANSTIEYKSNAFGGGLQNEILIANWAPNAQNITRLRLASNGLSVASASILAVPRPAGESTDFGNPLGFAQGPDGTLYVGETANNRIAVLKPAP